MFRRYVECSITYEPWQDLVHECLKQADYLMDPFLNMLADHNDFSEVVKSVQMFNLDLNDLSPYVSINSIKLLNYLLLILIMF
jgi:hypothetical protein